MQNVLEALDAGSSVVDADGDKDCIVMLLSSSAEMGDSVGTSKMLGNSVGTKDTRKEEGAAVLLLDIGDEDTGECVGDSDPVARTPEISQISTVLTR